MKDYLRPFQLTPETFWPYVVIITSILVYGKAQGWWLQ